MGAVRKILAALRGRALILHLDGARQVFASENEFAEFLRPRTRVSEDRLQEFADYDERELKREARKMLHAHRNVANVMVSAKESGEPFLAVWRHLDISKVPDDHDWPSILFALGKEASAADGYRHEALTQYQSFLEKRRDALDGFRKPEARPAEVEAAGELPAHDTLRGYSRLPHCHSVEVDMGEKGDVTVFLGANRYHLSRHQGIVALEESSHDKPQVLKPGRNTIGRSSQCSVRLEDELRDISRQHLVVEVGDDQRVSVMDVSSRGTYMREERFVDTHGDTQADDAEP